MMEHTRTAKPVTGAGTFDAREDAMLPARMGRRDEVAAHESARARRTWLGVALRIARDAAIAVAVMASVPIMIVATQGDRVWSEHKMGNSVRAKTTLSQVARPLVLPVDPSITPIEAGRAFHDLHPGDPIALFPEHARATYPEATWKRTFPSGAFSTAKTHIHDGPSYLTIMDAAAKGFSAQEMDYLRALASDPRWKDFDKVARAPAMDFVGARFRIPFAPAATEADIPLPGYRASRELAYASVSRAAYHHASGQRDSAEAALRAVISYGFKLVDNGIAPIDQLMGSVVVGIGREGLRRYLVAVGDPRATMPALAPFTNANAARASDASRLSFPPGTDVRAVLLARAADPNLLRAERFAALRLLSASSCTNVPELVLGPNDDVKRAFQDARTSLARFPGEQATIDLIASSPLRPTVITYNPLHALSVSAAAAAGTVLNNPRLAACTRVITGRDMGW